MILAEGAKLIVMFLQYAIHVSLVADLFIIQRSCHFSNE